MRPLIFGCLTGLLACSSEAGPAAYDPGLVLRSPEGGADASGCRALVTAYSDGGCRADWSCAEAGLLELVCGAGDAGTTCACLVDDNVVRTSTLDGGTCSNGTAPQAAHSTCGWSVP